MEIRLRKCVPLFRFTLQPTVFDWIMVWFQLSIPIFQCQIHTAEIENTVRIFGVMETTIQYMLVHKRSQSNIIRVVRESVVCLLFDDVLAEPFVSKGQKTSIQFNAAYNKQNIL